MSHRRATRPSGIWSAVSRHACRRCKQPISKVTATCPYCRTAVAGIRPERMAARLGVALALLTALAGTALALHR